MPKLHRIASIGERAVACRLSAWIALLALTLLVTVAAPEGIASERPNVVLIISDDQAFTDYGFMGHPQVHTPHLDELARQSLVFKRGYSAAPICRASLASIVTGLYPAQHGVTGNDISNKRGSERIAEDQVLQRRFADLPTLPRVLQQHGYVSFQTGKWWEGSYSTSGFTDGMTSGELDDGGRHGDSGLAIGRRGLQPIKRFIDGALKNNTPFFVWYAPMMPHLAHNPPPQFLKRYQDSQIPENVARYYGMCEWFDVTCGRLLSYLDEKGIADNTLVVYVTDNGWTPITAETELPAGWKLDFAPRSKASCYEAGIRTPIMFRFPKRIQPATPDDLASSVDLMPTILKFCGIEPPANLPGLNLLDAKARQNRIAIFGEGYAVDTMVPGNPAKTRQYRWCIDGWLKLLVRDSGLNTGLYAMAHNWDQSTTQLFDLQHDPLELKNIADEQPRAVARLKVLLDEWRPEYVELSDADR